MFENRYLCTLLASALDLLGSARHVDYRSYDLLFRVNFMIYRFPPYLLCCNPTGFLAVPGSYQVLCLLPLSEILFPWIFT